MKSLAAFAVLCALALPGFAAVKRQTIEYRQDGTLLEGVLVYDDASTAKRPGVLVVHQWKGLGDYELKRAEMLAQLGFAAFCADIYGKGVRASNPQDASNLAAKYKDDRALLRARVRAALDQLRQQEVVDVSRLGALGYCFGGTTVLELARSGAKVAGVVSFHGGLNTPNLEDAKNIGARVLALHGADDPFVPPAEVATFEKEMREAQVDWQMVLYGGAVHSFTDWNAGNDNAKGSAYNEAADRRSWEAMKSFFAECFATRHPTPPRGVRLQ